MILISKNTCQNDFDIYIILQLGGKINMKSDYNYFLFRSYANGRFLKILGQVTRYVFLDCINETILSAPI